MNHYARAIDLHTNYALAIWANDNILAESFGAELDNVFAFLDEDEQSCVVAFGYALERMHRAEEKA